MMTFDSSNFWTLCWNVPIFVAFVIDHLLREVTDFAHNLGWIQIKRIHLTSNPCSQLKSDLTFSQVPKFSTWFQPFQGAKIN
mmetsp:Transcript_32712/g.37091  ORF Transcript_32712/g.37091 Transcript_32712/m.37091 type:complete len:82 (+) Transcript_32712:499-744(+)